MTRREMRPRTRAHDLAPPCIHLLPACLLDYRSNTKACGEHSAETREAWGCMAFCLVVL